MKSTIGLIAGVVAVAITVGFWSTVIYIAWHFIEKFW